jgi:hypothetical protein
VTPLVERSAPLSLLGVRAFVVAVVMGLPSSGTGADRPLRYRSQSNGHAF